MTPRDLAQLHAADPTGHRAWSEAEFSALRSAESTLYIDCLEGFAIGQIVFDEAELFLIMVKPNFKKQGFGRQILSAFESDANLRGAARVILEVASGNVAARSLYASQSYREIARRKNYYVFPSGNYEDAIVMEKQLSKTSEIT